MRARRVLAAWPVVLIACVEFTRSHSVANAESDQVSVGEEHRVSSAWVVERALRVSPTLSVARARIAAARARVGQAAERDDPMLMVRAWEVPLDVVSAPPGQIMIMAQQSLPLSAIVARREEIARTDVRDAEVEREMARHAVAMEAGLAHVAFWEARERRDVLEKLVRVATDSRGILLARASTGRVMATDVALANVEIARLSAEHDAAAAEVDAQRARLRVLLALPDTVELGEPSRLDVHALPASSQALIADAQRRRPELALGRISLARARALEGAASALDAPVLTVGAGYMRMEAMPDAWMLELGVSVPIWRAARSARHEEADALAAGARETANAWRRTVAQEVVSAYEDLRVAHTRKEALEESVAPAIRAALDAAVAELSASDALPRVVEALRSNAELELELLEAKATVLRAELMLSHAVGHPVHMFREVSP